MRARRRSHTSALLYDADGDMTGDQTAGSASRSFYQYDASGNLVAVHSGAPASSRTGWACMDMNYDGKINTLDLSAISASYNKTTGTPGFDPRADLDWNGKVNLLDISAESSYVNLTTCGSSPAASSRTRYIRDGDGTLVKRDAIASGVFPNAGATSSTVYVGGIYETSTQNGTPSAAVKYYSGYGRTVAMRQVLPNGADNLNWLAGDHLGSMTMILDGQANVISDARYWPYGAMRTGGIAQADKLYTGQQMEPGDAAPGPDDYKASFYRATLGRSVRSMRVGFAPKEPASPRT